MLGNQCKAKYLQLHITKYCTCSSQLTSFEIALTPYISTLYLDTEELLAVGTLLRLEHFGNCNNITFIRRN